MKTEIDLIFGNIKDTTEREIESLYSLNSRAKAYVGAFWLFYCDFTVIHPPCFALNYTDNIDSNNIEDIWAPSEWEHDVVDQVFDALKPLYEELTEYLSNKSDEVWELAIENNYDIHCEISKNLTKKARLNQGYFSKWNKTDCFVVLVLEQRDGEEFYNRMVESSVEPKILDKLEGILFEV